MNVKHSLIGKARMNKEEMEMMDSGDITYREHVLVVLLSNA